jgi:hypothetical protein
MFWPDGRYDVLFGTPESTPAPRDLAVVDVRIGGGIDDVNYGAYLYAISPEGVHKYISGEHYNHLYGGLPPPEQ